MRTLDIARNMIERYQRYDIMENYYGLLAYYGWAHCAAELSDERFLNKLVQRLMAYPENLNKQPPFHFESYKCGGNGKAYLLYADKIGKISHSREKRSGSGSKKRRTRCRFFFGFGKKYGESKHRFKDLFQDRNALNGIARCDDGVLFRSY